jgi:hypothetical protein
VEVDQAVTLKRAAVLCLLAACAPTGPTAPATPAVPVDRSVVILVWDGLRPDAVTPTDTPNLARLRDTGVDFTDNHATYPTFTMMNSASFATGAFPDLTGYYGNVVWQPGATGNDAAGKPVDYRQPVFSEDYAVLDALKSPNKQLLLVETLFAAAQAAGMPTLAIGKSGAAYLQDTGRGGMFLDERADGLAGTRSSVAGVEQRLLASTGQRGPDDQRQEAGVYRGATEGFPPRPTRLQPGRLRKVTSSCSSPTGYSKWKMLPAHFSRRTNCTRPSLATLGFQPRNFSTASSATFDSFPSTNPSTTMFAWWAWKCSTPVELLGLAGRCHRRQNGRHCR